MISPNPTLIFLILAGISYALIVVVVLRRRDPQDRAAGMLVLYAALSLLWTLGQALPRLARLTPLAGEALTRALLHGLLLLSLLFLQLTCSFLRLEGPGWAWWGLGAAWIVASVVLHENPLALPDGMWIGPGWTFQRRELALGVSAAGWGSLMGAATLLTARAHRRAQQPLHRNRITHWGFPLSLTVAGAALFFAGRWPLSGGLHLLGALAAAYAVLTYRLIDVRQIARRTVSYLIITLLTVVIYTAGFLITEYAFFQTVPGYSSLLAGATMALVLAVLFDPLLNLVQRLVDRLISGASYDPGHTLREYSASVSNILDLERLAAIAVELISEAMGVRRGALFVVHRERGEEDEADEDGRFRLRCVGGSEKELPAGTLSAASPMADYVRQERRPLTQYDVDLHPRFRQIPPAESAWLARLDMDVYVPIYAQGAWIGLLALGPKVSGDRYFDHDLTLLSTLADQTAVALENARLFDDLKSRHAEIERLNEKLSAANRELTCLDQARSDFIDIASRELRTPLAHLRGYTDILGTMIEDESLTRDAGSQLTQGLKSAMQRLEKIVNTMSDVSRIETESLELDLMPTPVVSSVEAAVETWAAGLEERQQTLVVEGLTDLPVIIADSRRLRQVFSHLIQNAIKFTPDGGRIRITGQLVDGEERPEDRRIEVVVADNGIGVAPSDLERIFTKFYRAGEASSQSDDKTAFKATGPGLGLTIARGVVEAHGGRIWCESLGRDERICPGSAFHVVLPVQPRHVASATLEAYAAAARVSGGQG